MSFYTVADLQDMLKLSATQVYGLITCGKLRCHRFTRAKNGAIRVSEEQLSDYLKSTEIGAQEESVPPKPEVIRLQHLRL